MKKETAKRKAEDVRNRELSFMAGKSPDVKARERFNRPAYQAAKKLIQAQGKQMENGEDSIGGQKNT